MNAHQIELVQSSFAKVEPIAGVAADLFYNRLFELDPSLRPMFKGNLHRLLSGGHGTFPPCLALSPSL